MSALDGGEALGELEGDTWPDFVFLDYNMKVGDSGDEVGTRQATLWVLRATDGGPASCSCGALQICRKMRRIFGSTPIPIVMCTAMSEGDSALTKCTEAGADDYLLKPYERAKMIALVEKYCSGKVGTCCACTHILHSYIHWQRLRLRLIPR